jgi:site-specific recombinase XerD
MADKSPTQPVENPMTIAQAAAAYLDSVALARSQNTARTYQNGITNFLNCLEVSGLDPKNNSLSALHEDTIAWFAAYLKDLAPTTERLYLTAAVGFFDYLAGENLLASNLMRIRLLIHQRARRPGVRLPQFPADSIDKIIANIMTTRNIDAVSGLEQLRLLRDRAFLLTLADTGLRVHEACALRRGDLDWINGRAQVIGKGDRQDIVRFTQRVETALKEYLAARSAIDGTSGRSLSSQPLFARHDKGAGKKVKPITTATGRNIVTDAVRTILGEDAVGTITPHSFRHYFVTRVLRSSNNLKLAQELARHRNIAVTQRYAHLNDDELDKGYRQAIEKNGRSGEE